MAGLGCTGSVILLKFIRLRGGQVYMNHIQSSEVEQYLDVTFTGLLMYQDNNSNNNKRLWKWIINVHRLSQQTTGYEDLTPHAHEMCCVNVKQLCCFCILRFMYIFGLLNVGYLKLVAFWFVFEIIMIRSQNRPFL